MTEETPPRLPGWSEPVACPRCRDGYMQQKQGRYGVFFGCTRYPACHHTMNMRDMSEWLDPPDPSEGGWYGE